MLLTKPVQTSFATTTTLTLATGTPMADPSHYRMVVGSLQYLTLTRPDISFSVNRVCQFMYSLTEEHWRVVKRILRYLKDTSHYGLLLQLFFSTHIQAFSDADWPGSIDDRKSTSDYAIYFGDNLVSWCSRKQRTVARSSTEFEYKALVDASAEISCFHSLLTELGFRSSSPPILWCDNLGATYLSANPVFHARTKHVEIDFHFVREKVARKELHIQFISTKDQIADIFTNGLPSQSFRFFRDKLKIRSSDCSA